MKATKKIVGAACALVAAVALSAGSTFAWFSSNGTVTATGLEIDVSTSNAFLIIADSADNLKNNETTLDLSLAEGETAKKLLPSAYETTATLAGSGDASITNAKQWYTAQGLEADNGEIDITTKKALTDADFSNYVVVTDVFVSVSEGSPSVEHVILEMGANPTWTSTNEEGKNNDVLSVVILYQTMENSSTATLGEWKKEEANAANNHVIGTAGKLDLGAVEYGKYIQVHVMVYMDGNNEDVKTTNSLNLAGVTLDFTFTDGGDTPVTPNP